MQETCVGSLGWEDPLGKEMATHSTILAWEIPWTDEPGRLQSMGLQKSRTQLKRLNNNNLKSNTLYLRTKSLDELVDRLLPPS